MKLNINIDLDNLVSIAKGCNGMPDFFEEEIYAIINSKCFNRLTKGETLEERKDSINRIWKAIHDSGNERLITRFAKDALSSSKTGEELAKNIYIRLARFNLDIFISLLSNLAGDKYYPSAIVSGLSYYFQTNWQLIKKEEKVDEISPIPSYIAKYDEIVKRIPSKFYT